jgi:hypothetical protein
MVETRRAYKAMITRSKRNGYTKFMVLTENKVKKIKNEIVKNKKSEEESSFCVPLVTVDKSVQTDFVEKEDMCNRFSKCTDEEEEMDDNCSIQSDVTELDDLEEYAKKWSMRWFQEKEKEPDYWNESLPNFDDAHDAWMDNKRRGDNGTFYYICGKVMKNGKKCQRAQCDKIGIYSGCKMHFAWEEKEHKMY